MAIRDDDISMKFFRDKSKEHNLKTTPQRVVIYKELRKSKDHPSADMVFKKARKTFPNISFDTVNRTVLTFAKIGVVNIVEGYGDPKRFDPDIESHHHFRCIKCNNIKDFHSKAFDNLKVPEEIKKHFVVVRKRVCIEGVCGQCQKR